MFLQEIFLHQSSADGDTRAYYGERFGGILMRQALAISIILMGSYSCILGAKPSESAPSVFVVASADKVRAAAVSRLLGKGYKLDSDTPLQMVFSKEQCGGSVDATRRRQCQL
jgi:hypothetical protein